MVKKNNTYDNLVDEKKDEEENSKSDEVQSDEVKPEKVQSEEEKKAREYIHKKRQEMKKKREDAIKKAEKESKKVEEQTLKDLEKLNKKYKTSIVTFGTSNISNLTFIDSGMSDVNVILSGDSNFGYARGRMVELYGPEGAGKTWILSKAYAKALDSGMKVLHYDAEGTYNKIFASMNGVDVSKLHYSDNDRCEEILSEIEQLCLNNEYDIIGIDSLAALVPQKMADDDLGKNNYSPLANSIARCLPRVSSAIKRSKTVVFFVNQLRDNVGELYGDPEKTPGGRSLKFYATYRLDVRRRSSPKAEFPHMYNADGRQIGHRLCVRTKKNKVYPPGLECMVDLMYQKPSRIFDIISNAINTDVIQRQRTKTGELRGKKLSYRDLDFAPDAKCSAGEVFFWLKENGLICRLLSDMGIDDFEEFLISGDISDEDVEKYMIETI